MTKAQFKAWLEKVSEGRLDLNEEFSGRRSNGDIAIYVDAKDGWCFFQEAHYLKQVTMSGSMGDLYSSMKKEIEESIKDLEECEMEDCDCHLGY